MPLSRSKPRILLVGQAKRATGYSRVLESIAKNIAASFDTTYFGIDYDGPVVAQDWRLEPNRAGDLFGYSEMPRLLKEVNPHLIFMCHDHDLHAVLEPQFSRYSRGSKVVFYCPVGRPIEKSSDVAHLAGIDRLVAYTNFGRRALERALRGLRRGQIDVIPHGVDTATFYPLHGYKNAEDLRRNRRLARALLFPNQPELRDAFIVLNANRNIRRKRIDLTLKAFAEFARGKASDVRLYLHMGMRDKGVDIPEMAKQLGIEARLLLTPSSQKRPSAPDKELNWIYNACDVGLNTAAGEGWGLVAFEHAATGTAQIVPAHSACEELWKDIGLLVASGETGTLDTFDIAAKLDYCYSRREFLHEASQAAYLHATAPRFRWESISAQWERLFNETILGGRQSSLFFGSPADLQHR